jgi:hypothetical protein
MATPHAKQQTFNIPSLTKCISEKAGTKKGPECCLHRLFDFFCFLFFFSFPGVLSWNINTKSQNEPHRNSLLNLEFGLILNISSALEKLCNLMDH